VKQGRVRAELGRWGWGPAGWNKTQGFTLLEVLVAISILGLALSVILSSQVGIFSSAQRSQNLSVAVGLARCRMNETELVLLRDGYPLTDQNDSGECCEEEDDRAFRCEWKIERVELPQATELGGADGGADPGGLGLLGTLASFPQSGGALGGDGGLGGLASLLGGSGSGAEGAMGGAMAMAPMVMGLVYPDLKPMLEASIRKVTVTVIWKEGINERDLSVTQYVTNPMQGGLDPNAAAGLGDLVDSLGGQNPATNPAPTGTTPGRRP
jgi:general secretion pathway protein I